MAARKPCNVLAPYMLAAVTIGRAQPPARLAQWGPIANGLVANAQPLAMGPAGEGLQWTYGAPMTSAVDEILSNGEGFFYLDESVFPFRCRPLSRIGCCSPSSCSSLGDPPKNQVPLASRTNQGGYNVTSGGFIPFDLSRPPRAEPRLTGRAAATLAAP